MSSNLTEQELTTVCFRDPQWLALNPLLIENVIEYFSYSQFYDKTCNNETIKMQSRFNQFDLAEMNKGLHDMTGIEYEVTLSMPPQLFVIAKQNRKSPTSASPIQYYYVINGTIYQAPNAYMLFANRIITSLHLINISFKEAFKSVRFDPDKGYWWSTDEKTDKEMINEIEEIENTNISYINQQESRIYQMRIDDRIAESVSKPIEIEEKVEEEKIKKTKPTALEDKLIVKEKKHSTSSVSSYGHSSKRRKKLNSTSSENMNSLSSKSGSYSSLNSSSISKSIKHETNGNISHHK
ncbi:MED6-domain-containing protein [Piromyces finnis]|uniref:Mediator of RNA polymerase II transcription subunit 6 n=1 Tax=Piromyces finnis TaxID=1754191 RepID=A0A1Y1VE87_9FUNG|nr:MED6-domain-containing protein [Piromyces finnis]|eukprot:ORX52589.1 MED6-domain-containing protein [Piromyces finnis]